MSRFAPYRAPDVRIVLIPNETAWRTRPATDIAVLAAQLLAEGAEYGIAVEVDSSDRTRPGEDRLGPSPSEGMVVVVEAAQAVVVDRVVAWTLDAVVAWFRRLRSRRDPADVAILGPDGRPLRQVVVLKDGSVREVMSATALGRR
ncbi:MAG TPA: hypothetical protein VKD47_09505 [Miltoncostaeaceae bacterium]|nr:hypothetical protein [Miltoncostaeaceae bacterium]